MQLRRRRQELSGRCGAPRASPPQPGQSGRGGLSSLGRRAECVKTRRKCIGVISPACFPSMSDEALGTTLAYTGSRKVATRTAFQDELQEAISARAARQQTAEYSDDFDSDEAENVSISALDDYCKPSPLPRSVLRKSSHTEDKDVTRAEDKDCSSYRLSSFSAPSSLTRLSDKITSEKRVIAESPSPEGPWLASSSSPFPIHFHSTDETCGDSSLLMCGEGSPSKGQDQIEGNDCSVLRLENNGRESPSVIELMMTTVYEKTKKLQKSTDDHLEENLQTLEEQFVADGIKEMSLNEKSEDMAGVNTSELTVKKEIENKEPLSQKVKPSGRSLSSTYLKKAGKTIPLSTTTSSQYLGTLKVLDNKHLQKYSAELDKADNLRAAVYQDWLEKKRVFLMELQRIKRNKAENLKNANEKKEAAKKEEAIASFEAWKAMKEREAKKKLAEKKKLEELKKQRAAEQNEEKKEEAQKAFEKWKEKKAEYLKEQSKKEKRAEKIKKKKEEEAIAEKKRDSMSAVDKWNEKKEEFIKQKKTEKIQEKRKQEAEHFEKQEKDKRAMEEYERWLTTAVIPEKILKRKRKRRGTRLRKNKRSSKLSLRMKPRLHGAHLAKLCLQGTTEMSISLCEENSFSKF